MQQQTVLRVQTNIPNPNLILTDGTLTIESQSGFTINGSGTQSSPYTGTSAGGNILFNVNNTNGSFHYTIYKQTGQTQNIYLIQNGVETLVATATPSMTTFSGTTIVSVGNSIRLDLPGTTTLNSIYFVP